MNAYNPLANLPKARAVVVVSEEGRIAFGLHDNEGDAAAVYLAPEDVAELVKVLNEGIKFAIAPVAPVGLACVVGFDADQSEPSDA